MKKGITAISVAIMVVVILILVSTVSISLNSTIQNSNKLIFALEISEIQEEVTKYYNESSDSTYPISGNVYTIGLNQITEESIIQFESETKNENNEIMLYEIDLTSIGIADTKYGNKKNDKDVYVVSKDTGIVYYLDGIKSGSKTYYALTQDLIDIKARNENENESSGEGGLTPLTISSDGIVEKTLSSGEKEKYISNIKVAGDEIRTIKYANEIVLEEQAKEYFKNNGDTVVGDRIRLKSEERTATIYAENVNGQYVIKHYYGYPVIPKGFVASDLETEDEVEEGLVIYEGNEKVSEDPDAQTTRNQFVWVPVIGGMSNFIQRDGYFRGEKQTYVESKSIHEPMDIKVSNGVTLSKENDLTGEFAEYEKMRESVEKYGGFYIARYEAGDGSATEPRTGVTEAKPVVIMKDKFAYTYTVWGASMTNVKPFTKNDVPKVAGAVYLSRNMYPENNDDYGVVSTLIYGVQWDTTMYFLRDIKNPYYDHSYRQNDYYIYDSYRMGWYVNNWENGNPNHKTGIDVNTKAANMTKNIYDLAGNLEEWTMEANNNNTRVYRGAYWISAGFYAPASNRYAASPGYVGEAFGFRVALYLK